MRKIKRMLFVIALALLLVSLSAFAAFANTEESSAEPAVAIKSFNLNLGEAVHIKISAAGENLPEGAKIQILVWNAPQTDYTINSENPPVVINPHGINEGNGRTEFYYTKVAAAQMADNYYFVACVNCGGEYIYSSVQKYSVLQYAYGQLAKTNITSDFRNLLSSMLQYGAAAQIHFNYSTDRLANDTFYQITVENGVLEDGQWRGLFLSKDTPTLIANPAENGYEFIGWTNSAGTIVSTETTYTLPSVSASETYTAQYEGLDRILPTGEIYFEFLPLNDGTYAIKAANGATLPSELVIPAYYNGAKVTAIADDGFAAHTEIKSVKFEYTNVLTTIGSGAFEGCSNILTFTVPSTVSEIGELAFGGCYRLVEIYNRSELNIAAGSAENGGIASFALDVHTNKNAESKLSMLADGCIIRSDSSSVTIVAFNSSADKLTLPDDINGYSYTVNAYAFADNATLKVLDIGTGLTAISDYAFKDAVALNYIITTSADSIAHIGNNAFEGCIDLTSIYLSTGVITIGADAFSGCVSLTVFTPLATPATGWNEKWNSSNCNVRWNYTHVDAETPVAPLKEDE